MIDSAQALTRCRATGQGMMVGQGKRHLERRTRLKCSIGEISQARRQLLDMSPIGTKQDPVIRKCGPQSPEISLIERKMHMVVAKKVEYVDLISLICWQLDERSPSILLVG